MTFRLVGLMSFVLLLSLAAFGFLMNYYQDQVMDEVKHTVSTVGRAAINSFNFHTPADHDIHTVDLPEGVDRERLRMIEVVADGPAGTDPRGPFEVPGDEPNVVFFATRGYTWISGDEDAGETIEEPVGKRVVRKHVRSDDGGGSWTYMVQVDGVSAVEDPVSNEIFLSIPTLRTSGSGSEETLVELREDDTDAAPPAAREIRLPISTADYGDLFAEARSRSLYMALGVFAVGTALSAGLASRFTRPIRKLDRGIHRISEGDLDVQVDVEGTDELGRLAAGFNEMTRELQRNRERAMELTRREKLSALGRLAAGVAHEVRNPLHSINLTLQHLNETSRPDDGPRRREFDRGMEIIKEEIARLDNVVGNFLRFARSDTVERRPVQLDALVRETCRLVRKEAEWRDIELEIEIDGQPPAIDANVESLRSSVLNLVLNSFEAMPDGGRVTVRVSFAAGEVRVEVQDSGEGIADADRERVFDFAYTTKDGGNGLGLALVHQCVVEEHGGRVALDSRPGEGTKVTLAFPVEDLA